MKNYYKYILITICWILLNSCSLRLVHPARGPCYWDLEPLIHSRNEYDIRGNILDKSIVRDSIKFGKPTETFCKESNYILGSRQGTALVYCDGKINFVHKYKLHVNGKPIRIGNYFVYPDLYGCKMVAEAFLVHLYWFSIPYIILILSYFVKKLLKRPSRELTFFFGDEITIVSENGITILSETSAVAYGPALNTLLGVGETVKRFPQAKIVYPIKSGVICDFQAGEDLVVQLVKKLTKELQLRKYTLEAIVYAPSITGDLEIRAFEDTFEKAGINNISIVRY